MPIQTTNKATEALQSAQKLAADSAHPELVPAHLAVALLHAPEGVPAAVLNKLEVDPRVLAGELVAALDKLPRTEGAQVAPSRAFADVVRDADALARKLSDDYVSTEHLLLALARKGGPEVQGLFAARKLTPERLEAALAEVRGDRRVTSPDPEASFEALEKYARDLTEEARRRQARPGHRPRQRDPPRDAGALAPAQEQPRADRRSRRGQDRHRRGPGQPHRGRRRARDAQGQAHPGAGPGRAARRRQVPRRVRGAPQGRAEGDRRGPGRGRSCSSTSCTRWSARAAPRAPWTRPTCSSRPWRAASCTASARRRWTSTASTSRRTRRSSAASCPCWSASPRSRTRSRSCAASRSATRCTTACASGTRRCWPRRAWPSGTSATASCPTRPST